MKNKLLTVLSFSVLSLFLSNNLFAQVGIGTTIPTETLHVNGNVRIDGALMPNNIAGNANQVLISGGAGNPPTWGPDLSNVSEITRYLVTGPDILSGLTYSLTVTIPGVTAGSTAIISITGNWSSAIFDDITIHNIECRTGEIRFAISNNTFFTTYPTMQYNLTIIQ